MSDNDAIDPDYARQNPNWRNTGADPLHQQAEALAKENANLLRGWIRGQRIGGCRLLSEGAHCKCPLCLLDAIMDCHREALQRVQAETWEQAAQIADGFFVRARKLDTQHISQQIERSLRARAAQPQEPTKV